MRDSLTIKREEVTLGEGDAIKTWTTAARGSSFPSSDVSCRIQDLPGAEAITYGLRGDVRSYKIYFDEDPVIDTRDRVYFDDAGGTERECVIVGPSFSFDGPAARLWKCIATEYIAIQE